MALLVRCEDCRTLFDTFVTNGRCPVCSPKPGDDNYPDREVGV